MRKEFSGQRHPRLGRDGHHRRGGAGAGSEESGGGVGRGWGGRGGPVAPREGGREGLGKRKRRVEHPKGEQLGQRGVDTDVQGQGGGGGALLMESAHG